MIQLLRYVYAIWKSILSRYLLRELLLFKLGILLFKLLLPTNLIMQFKWNTFLLEANESYLFGQIIVRPATIFGAEDRFLNWIAYWNASSFPLPIINNGANLVQPVFVHDVAKAIMHIMRVRNLSILIIIKKN